MYTLMLSFLPPPRLLLARTPAATCAPWRLHLLFTHVKHTCKPAIVNSHAVLHVSDRPPLTFLIENKKCWPYLKKKRFRNFWANLMEIFDHFHAQGGQSCARQRKWEQLSVCSKTESCQLPKNENWTCEHKVTLSLSLSLSLLWFLLCNGIAWLPDRLPSRLSYSHRWLSLSCKLPDLHFWAPSGGPSGLSAWQLILSPASPTLQHPQGKKQPKEIEKSSYSSLPLEGGVIVKKWDL